MLPAGIGPRALTIESSGSSTEYGSPASSLDFESPSASLPAPGSNLDTRLHIVRCLFLSFEDCDPYLKKFGINEYVESKVCGSLLERSHAVKRYWCLCKWKSEEKRLNLARASFKEVKFRAFHDRPFPNLELMRVLQTTESLEAIPHLGFHDMPAHLSSNQALEDDTIISEALTAKPNVQDAGKTPHNEFQARYSIM